MLVKKMFKQLKTWFGALTVKSHKFWAVLYSSHGEMNIEERVILFTDISLYVNN